MLVCEFVEHLKTLDQSREILTCDNSLPRTREAIFDLKDGSIWLTNPPGSKPDETFKDIYIII